MQDATPDPRNLDVLPRLLTLAAGQTAQLRNSADLAGPFQLSRPTIQEYVTLLESIFLIDTLAPWHNSRLKRLVESPKIHVGDTGVACALLGVDRRSLTADRGVLGHLLETFVFQELRRQASWHLTDIRLHHFRDRDGYEVDIVLEYAGQRLFGLEVKASATVTERDFRGLRKLQQATGSRFTRGVVLYDRETSAGFGDGFHAVPIRMLWENEPSPDRSAVSRLAFRDKGCEMDARSWFRSPTPSGATPLARTDSKQAEPARG